MSGKLKGIILLLAAFGLGVVSGVSWHRYKMHRWPERHSEMFAEHRIKRLKSQLKLTPEQEKTVTAIFQNAHQRATQVNEEVSWDLADIHRDSVKAIKEVLTPQQLEQFQKMHQRFHARHTNIPPDDLEESTRTVQSKPS